MRSISARARGGRGGNKGIAAAEASNNAASGFKPAPLLTLVIPAFILGPGLEETLPQTFLLNDSGLLYFPERPVVFAFVALCFIALVLRIRMQRRADKQARAVGW